jgi:hypothetical protein
MKADIPALLDGAETLADIFEVVKNTVWKSKKMRRGGLMLGLADLGNYPRGFFGAFYPVGTNVIVMNKIPLRRIKETMPKLYKPYAFHVLLHEYLHSLGYLDENEVRQMVLDISIESFGEEHDTALIAKDSTQFFQHLTYPDVAWQPENLHIELVDDFDRSSTFNYIA